MKVGSNEILVLVEQHSLREPILIEIAIQNVERQSMKVENNIVGCDIWHDKPISFMGDVVKIM